MNVRKPVDYSAMFAALDTLMAADLPQMELYCEIGRLVSGRPEKGAAVAAAEYLCGAYPDLTKRYGIIPSMSRRGNCYDNAMAENFFSILKSECIYRQKIKSFRQAKELIDEFIYFYNHERIQIKTGEAPLVRRLST